MISGASLELGLAYIAYSAKCIQCAGKVDDSDRDDLDEDTRVLTSQVLRVQNLCGNFHQDDDRSQNTPSGDAEGTEKRTDQDREMT